MDVAGTVIRKGNLVPDTQLRVGDRALAPMIGHDGSLGQLKNKTCVKKSKCVRISGKLEDSLAWGSDLCAVVLAIRRRAQIQSGERILIVDPCTNFGFLAVQVCQVSHTGLKRVVIS